MHDFYFFEPEKNRSKGYIHQQATSTMQTVLDEKILSECSGFAV